MASTGRQCSQQAVAVTRERPACRVDSEKSRQRRIDSTTVGRRQLALSLASIPFLCPPAFAASEGLKDSGVDVEESPLMQELLKRTEENREQRAQQRLEDYNRRNFKDYFMVDADSERTAEARGLSVETQAQIKKWLEDHPDP
eukprot:evm.model.scf_2920.4 EVM.evm.TU.scf_2920.4   scf_2920:12751-14770(+)